MKTQSLTKTSIEAIITISLIALLGLLTALIYALLALLGTEPSNQAILTAQVQTPEVTGKNLTTTNPLLKDAKAAPKLKAAVKEAKTQIIAEVATKPLTKMTVQELRPLARERKIPNWRKLKKKELLFHLTV